MSAGTDGVARLHSLLHSEPLASLKVTDAYVFQVQWSPSRPLVFAAATSQGRRTPPPPLQHRPALGAEDGTLSRVPSGEVQLFDLGQRSLRPVATLEQGGGGGAATCLAFNALNPQLLAVGRSDGTVGVWHLSTDLTEQRPREVEQLEQLATQLAG